MEWSGRTIKVAEIKRTDELYIRVAEDPMSYIWEIAKSARRQKVTLYYLEDNASANLFLKPFQLDKELYISHEMHDIYKLLWKCSDKIYIQLCYAWQKWRHADWTYDKIVALIGETKERYTILNMVKQKNYKPEVIDHELF